jgi:hypothetical protein
MERHIIIDAPLHPSLIPVLGYDLHRLQSRAGQAGRRGGGVVVDKSSYNRDRMGFRRTWRAHCYRTGLWNENGFWELVGCSGRVVVMRMRSR